MVKSTFSGKEIPKGTGLIYVKKDGSTLYFASNKEKTSYLDKKYRPHKTKWTNEYHLDKKRRKK